MQNMKSTNLSAREQVMKKIRGTFLKGKIRSHIPDPNLNTSIFKSSEDSLPAIFAKEFNKNNGRFIFCKDISDFMLQYQQLIKKAVHTSQQNVYAWHYHPG